MLKRSGDSTKSLTFKRCTKMAHECPECGHTCYCGGDIDDINFVEPPGYCRHCDKDEDEDEDDWDWCMDERIDV